MIRSVIWGEARSRLTICCSPPLRPSAAALASSKTWALRRTATLPNRVVCGRSGRGCLRCPGTAFAVADDAAASSSSSGSSSPNSQPLTRDQGPLRSYSSSGAGCAFMASSPSDISTARRGNQEELGDGSHPPTFRFRPVVDVDRTERSQGESWSLLLQSRPRNPRSCPARAFADIPGAVARTAYKVVERRGGRPPVPDRMGPCPSDRKGERRDTLLPVLPSPASLPAQSRISL